MWHLHCNHMGLCRLKQECTQLINFLEGFDIKLRNMSRNYVLKNADEFWQAQLSWVTS